MTTCPECGAAVTPEVDFCPQCDAYLAWETPGGTPAGRPPTKPAPRPAPQPVPVAAAPEAMAAAPPTAPAPQVHEEPAVVSLPVITIPPWPFEDAPASAPSADGSPVAILPGKAAPKAPAPGPTGPPTPTRDGSGIRCGSCGASNTAGRHFCTSCGAEIVAAAPQPAAATTEPRRTTATFRKRSDAGRVVGVLVAVAVVVALAVTAFLLRDPLAAFAASAMDRVVGVAAVNPSRVTASGSAPGHPASAAHDGASNIAWEPSAPGRAIGQRLTFTFARPFRLVVVQILPGAATDAPTFLKSGRPTQVRLAIERAGQPPVERTVSIDDQPGPQRFDLGVDQVKSLTMTILRSNGSPSARVAIAEVEFSGR